MRHLGRPGVSLVKHLVACALCIPLFGPVQAADATPQPTPAMAQAASELRPRHQGYAFEQPQLLLRQRLFGLARGLSMLAAACLDLPQHSTPIQDAYASWHQPAESQPAAPGRDLLAPIKAWIFGGNTIVKAGVGILFVGLAFLAKYAAEHVSVPIEMRLAGIAAVAMVLLIVGWRLRHKRAGYAQVLQGGAVAVLYLTLFAAFRLYGVLAAGPVFAMMAAVVALSAALAILQDARALAVIGALGGFATPLLLIMMTIKFIMIVLVFMHLKYDHKLLSVFFYMGLVLAIVVYSVFLATFQFFDR